jgi:hypothetical protein
MSRFRLQSEKNFFSQSDDAHKEKLLHLDGFLSLEMGKFCTEAIAEVQANIMDAL